MYLPLQYHIEWFHSPPTPQILCALPIHPSLPLPKLQATTDLFTISIVFPFPKCHMVGIIQYIVFTGWLFSFSNLHLRFLHVFLFLDSSFLFFKFYYFLYIFIGV